MLSAQPEGNSPPPVTYNPDEFWLRTLLRWYIGLVNRPVPTIREIVERRPLLAGVFTFSWSVFLWSTLWLGLAEFDSFVYLVRNLDQSLALLLFFGVPIASLFVVVIVVLLHVAAGLMGGWGTLTTTFIGLAMNLSVGLIPAMAGMFVLAQFTVSDQPRNDPLGGRVFFTLIALSVMWVATLSTLLVRRNYGLSSRRSVAVVAGVTLIGLPVSLILSVLIILGVILLAFALD